MPGACSPNSRAPAETGQSVRVAGGKVVSITAGFVDPPAGAQADRPEGPVRPARPDRLPRAPDHPARPRPTPAPGRGFRSQGRARQRLPRPADPGRRLHHRARPRRTQARGDLRPARRRRRGQGSRAANPLRRRDPVAHRRPRPDLWLPAATSAPASNRAIGVCDGVDGCRRAVRAQVAQGADAIKFVATGGVLSNLRAGVDQQFTTDEIRTIVETAHHAGPAGLRPCSRPAGINAALTAGVDSIEHGSFLDDELDPPLPRSTTPSTCRPSSPG